MKLPDELIIDYFKVYTRVAEADISELQKTVSENPMDCKMRLGEEIVSRYHGPDAAREEKAWFISTFSKRETPEEVPVLQMGGSRATIFSILRKFFPGAEKSSNDLKRLVTQAAVSVNGEKVTDKSREIELTGEVIVKVGKRTWFKVQP